MNSMFSEAPTLTIYMVQEGEKWVEIESQDPVIGQQLTKVLQVSQDNRPLLKRRVKSGERLTYHVKADNGKYVVTPSEWVVVKTFSYDLDFSSLEDESPEFKDVQIAYCARIPLSEEELKERSYDIVTKVSVDSFGGDEDAYQRYLVTH